MATIQRTLYLLPFLLADMFHLCWSVNGVIFYTHHLFDDCPTLDSSFKGFGTAMIVVGHLLTIRMLYLIGIFIVGKFFL